MSTRVEDEVLDDVALGVGDVDVEMTWDTGWSDRDNVNNVNNATDRDIVADGIDTDTGPHVESSVDDDELASPLELDKDHGVVRRRGARCRWG